MFSTWRRFASPNWINSGQTVRYWREEPLDVDGVIEGDWGQWVVEVKTSRFTINDLRGLAEFSKRHRAFRPLVITEGDWVPEARRAGFAAMRWSDFLLNGPIADQR